HGEQPADLDLLRHLAKLDLYALTVTKLDAEPLAVRNVGLRDLHAALGETEPAHAVRQPRRTEPDLRDLQSIAFLQQNIFCRDFQSVEFEFTMAAVLVRPHDGNTPQDAPARLVLVKQERGQPRRLSSLVRATRMKCPAPSAPVANHLCPLTI